MSSLDVTFIDQPIRVGPDFVYPAVNRELATTPGNYWLVGDEAGIILIESVDFIDSTVDGDVGPADLAGTGPGDAHVADPQHDRRRHPKRVDPADVG